MTSLLYLFVVLRVVLLGLLDGVLKVPLLEEGLFFGLRFHLLNLLLQTGYLCLVLLNLLLKILRY